MVRHGEVHVINVRGDALKVDSLLGLLGGAAGLELSVQDGPVSIVSEQPLGPGMSAELRARLREMIDEQVKAARVDVDTTGIDFGKFGNWQILNAVNAVGVNAGAAGIGTAIAIHEIWENYASRTGNGNDQGQYGPAHRLALGVEAIVAAQLTARPGGRVAAAAFRVQNAGNYLLDYDGYFVHLVPRPQPEWPAHGKYAAQFRGRQEILAATIDLAGITPGHRISPGLVETVVEFMGQHENSTARVTGLRTGAEPEQDALLRSAAVRSALIVAMDEDDYAERDGTGIELGEDQSKGPGADLGARRPWTSPAGDIATAPGARISVQSPT
jgi:hypothetical protein